MRTRPTTSTKHNTQHGRANTTITAAAATIAIAVDWYY